MGWFRNQMTPVRESDQRLIEANLILSNQFRTNLSNLDNFLDAQTNRASELLNLSGASSVLGQELQTAINQLSEYKAVSQPRIPRALEERTETITHLRAQFDLPRRQRTSISLRRGDMPNHAEDVNNKTMREWISFSERYKKDLTVAIQTIDKADRQLKPSSSTQIERFLELFNI